MNRVSVEAIQARTSGVAREVIEDFLSRMDEDYLSTFSADDVSTHIRMSCTLSLEHPIHILIQPHAGTASGEFDIVIVGFDYLSEFSIFCGLLSAFGLDIRAGDIYSFRSRPRKQTERRIPAARARSGRPPSVSARKIVDIFRVGIKAGETFDESKQREFADELQALARLLAAGSSDQARERLNRFLIERAERMNEPLSGLLSPIQIRFDNQLSPDWTVMYAESEDTFAFLYALSNALAMRGVYIHSVKIRSVANEARDQFCIADRLGHKIEAIQEQERLRMAVAMITHFTRFLPQAPDPAKALRHFDQFLDKVETLAEKDFPDRVIAFLARDKGMHLLAQLLGSSDFLWDDFLSMHFEDLLPVLENLNRTSLKSGACNKESLASELRPQLATAAGYEDKKTALNRFKDHQVFLIDSSHLLDPQATLIEFSRALTDLAELVIEEAARAAWEFLSQRQSAPLRQDGTPCAFAICGLGKFGGREMGYASDLELMFVHEAAAAQGSASDQSLFFESLAKHVVDFVEAPRKGIFHIDL
jgi:glutamate-ammonia-ligase adenylyltransferase